MDRRGKAADGGKAAGGGKGVSVPTLAFICHLCKIGFSYEDDLQVHQMTDHASKTDLADDDAQTGAPPTFVGNPMFGPKQSDFTPHDSTKIQKMLEDCIGGPETVKMPVIPPPLVPPSQNFFGEWRGIQGRCNSCYLDVFFMLFAFSTAFDGIFTQEALNESIFLRIVLFEIVIPLRNKIYVKRDVTAMLRTFLADATRNREYLTNTWDFTEFLMDLVKQVDFSNVCNFIGDSIVCNFLIQLEGIQHHVLNLQQLVDHTMKINKITSPVPPEACILRVRPDHISEPPLCLPQSTVSLHGYSYRLSAIICMSRSHYTGFYRLDRIWVFFDSMSNSVGGHCVPLITPVPGFQEYLDSGCNERFLSQKNDGESRDSYDNRVKIGAFAFIFTREEIVPVLPPRIQGSSAVLPSGLAQPAPSSRKPSAGGDGAAAFSAQPAPSSRKPSASGGGAAPVPHRSPPSFGHSQPMQTIFGRPLVIQAGSLPDLVFSKSAGFFGSIANIVQDSKTYLDCVEVTGLSIPHGLNIALFGSFPVSNGENYHPYRGTIFMFNDESVLQYDGSVDDLSDPNNKKKFSEKVLKHWRDGNRVLTGIQFERCALKQIPSE